jgi:HlyD family secretion protein
MRYFILPFIAAFGLVAALRVVALGQKEIVPALPVASPSVGGFQETVAGAGIIETSSENIAIGTPLSGIIEFVNVRAGDSVETGAPLFTVDQRFLKSDLAVREANLSLARAQVLAARAVLSDAQAQWSRAEKLVQSRVISSDDADRLRFAEQRASALLQAAEAQVIVATADRDKVSTDIERSIVRAPIQGKILQVSARVGEYASGGQEVYVLMGNVNPLYVRVDIDENDAWRVEEGCRGQLIVRGNNQLISPLSFVRFEPFVVPKRSLTGASTERTDTRVLQILFKVESTSLPLFVGQQVDIFLESKKSRK